MFDLVMNRTEHSRAEPSDNSDRPPAQEKPAKLRRVSCLVCPRSVRCGRRTDTVRLVVSVQYSAVPIQYVVLSVSSTPPYRYSTSCCQCPVLRLLPRTRSERTARTAGQTFRTQAQLPAAVGHQTTLFVQLGRGRTRDPSREATRDHLAQIQLGRKCCQRRSQRKQYAVLLRTGLCRKDKMIGAVCTLYSLWHQNLMDHRNEFMIMNT